MAQLITVSLVDDLSGSQADETVTFGLDGKSYEIDLSSDNADHLRNVLTDFVAAARRPERASRVGGGNGVGGDNGAAHASAAERDETWMIRQWARTQGMRVADRGRIPDQVAKAYRQREQRHRTR